MQTINFVSSNKVNMLHDVGNQIYNDFLISEISFLQKKENINIGQRHFCRHQL
jgi:hypothetical protein